MTPKMPARINLILVVALTFISTLVFPVGCSSAMKRLYEDLFTDYNRLILPVANNKTKVKVTLGLKLGQILDLNLKQQILSTNVWVEQTWHDYKLTWEPKLYEDIDMIHVPAENIWIPDIVLFNNADGNYELTLVAKARLYSNGTVVWKPPTMFRSTCEIDVEYFPFDIQTCYLRFGSWTYAGDELELRHVSNATKVEIGIDLSQFYKNVEWDIIDVPAYYNEVYYDCCTEPYPDITFKIVIRRKMLFYLVNLLLPVALMTFMTVFVFYLPSDSNEKVTLSISILTSLIVFFLLMLEIIPPSSLAVPLFGKYLLFTLVLVSLSACVSVYVLNIHHRSPSVHSMSPRMRQVFLNILPRLLRLNRPDPRERSSLNRFRKKKIAQQMLKASSANKVYDLAQPLAASLNLIETLHKSYEFNPNEDEHSLFANNSDDDEGRYFRRYVDNYIEQMKRARQFHGEHSGSQKGCNCSRSCCETNTSCQMHKATTPNQAPPPLQRQTTASSSLQLRGLASSCCGGGGGGGGGTNLDWNESNADLMCPLVSNNKFTSLDESSKGCADCSRSRSIHQRPTTTSCGCTAHRSHLNMLNDDTLDMTFDCDNGTATAAAAAVENLPSPPPPPRQLTHLSDSMQNNKSETAMLSGSCSNNNLISTDDSSGSVSGPRMGGLGGATGAMAVDELMESGRLVDKLINSINLINNGSDENDTSTFSQNVDARSVQARPASSFHSRTLDSGLHQPHHQQQSATARGQQQQPVGNGGLCNCNQPPLANHQQQSNSISSARPIQQRNSNLFTGMTTDLKQPSDLLMSLRLSYDRMPAHVRAAIRSILFIADTIKNEDDENSAIEDWESMSMVVDRLFLWIFFLLCTFGSVIILALAPSLYDQRASIDDKLRIDIPPSNCSASVYAQ